MNRAERTIATAVFSSAAMLGAVGTACSSENTSNNIPALIEKVTAEQYPELKGFKLQQNGVLITNKGTPILWHNYTDSRFVEETLTETFSYFQDNIEAIKAEMAKQNLYRDVNIVPRPSKKSKLLYIVPLSVPPPRHFPDKEMEAATSMDKSGEAEMTFIRHREPKPDPGLPEFEDFVFNFALATEACQEAIMVNKPNGERDKDKQEQLCNSLGLMFAVRQTTLSHFTYADNAHKYSSTDLRYLVLSEQFYNQIPRVGRVLSSR